MPTRPLNRVIQHLLADLTPDGDTHRALEVRQGWTTYTIDPAAPGESQIRIIVPPGTTLEIRDLEFMWY
jgi:hypothetical protein